MRRSPARASWGRAWPPRRCVARRSAAARSNERVRRAPDGYHLAVVSRLVETVAPARLGTGFRWLLASSWVSNLGDGIAIAAGPLVVASLTRSPALVAPPATVQWLPPLIFGLFAGALTDRLDRRRIVVTVDVIRSAILAVLALTILTDRVSIGVVLGTLFLLG